MPAARYFLLDPYLPGWGTPPKKEKPCHGFSFDFAQDRGTAILTASQKN
jgi:hypothetical protein